MTHAEAQLECKRLAGEHPDRATHQWHTKEQPDGSWAVVKIALPPPASDLTAETRADEKPVTADDPRSNTFRDAPPFGAVGG